MHNKRGMGTVTIDSRLIAVVTRGPRYKKLAIKCGLVLNSCNGLHVLYNLPVKLNTRADAVSPKVTGNTLAAY